MPMRELTASSPSHSLVLGTVALAVMAAYTYVLSRMAKVEGNIEDMFMDLEEEEMTALYEHILNEMRQPHQLEPLDVEKLKGLISLKAQVLFVKDRFGRTLLHHAAQVNPSHQRPPLELLQHMIKVGGLDVLRTVDFRKDTPLHLSCFYSPSLEVVKLLVESYPQAVRMVNVSGETPLHIACSCLSDIRNNNISSDIESVITFLTEQWPLACLFLSSRIHMKAPTTTLLEPEEDMHQSSLSFSRQLPIDIAREQLRVQQRVQEQTGGLSKSAFIVQYSLEAVTEQTKQALLNAVFEGIPPSDDCQSTTKRQRYNKSNYSHRCRFVDDQDVKELLINKEMRARLPVPLRTYMDAFARMEAAGRSKALDGEATKTERVLVLASVLEHQDCLFAQLRQDPTICIREDDE